MSLTQVSPHLNVSQPLLSYNLQAVGKVGLMQNVAHRGLVRIFLATLVMAFGCECWGWSISSWCIYWLADPSADYIKFKVHCGWVRHQLLCQKLNYFNWTVATIKGRSFKDFRRFQPVWVFVSFDCLGTKSWCRKKLYLDFSDSLQPNLCKCKVVHWVEPHSKKSTIVLFQWRITSKQKDTNWVQRPQILLIGLLCTRVK